MYKPLRLNSEHFHITTPPLSVSLRFLTHHIIYSEDDPEGTASLILGWCGIARPDHMLVRRDCTSYHSKQCSLGSLEGQPWSHDTYSQKMKIKAGETYSMLLTKFKIEINMDDLCSYVFTKVSSGFLKNAELLVLNRVVYFSLNSVKTGLDCMCTFLLNKTKMAAVERYWL